MRNNPGGTKVRSGGEAGVPGAGAGVPLQLMGYPIPSRWSCPGGTAAYGKHPCRMKGKREEEGVAERCC